LILTAPGLSSAQINEAPVEAAGGDSVSASAGATTIGVPAQIGAIVAPLAASPGFSAPVAPRTAPPVFSAPVRDNLLSAPAEFSRAAEAEVPAASAADFLASPDQSGTPEALAAEGGAPNAATVSGARAFAPRTYAAADDAAGISRKAGFFDGWRSRGREVDANTPTAAAGNRAPNASASGLKPAASAGASAPAGLTVPSPRVQKTMRAVGLVVSFAMLAHWIAPHLAALHAGPAAATLASLHPYAALGIGAIGGVVSLASAVRANGFNFRAVRAAFDGTSTAAATVHIAFDVVQMALTHASVAGISPLLTGVAAVILAGRAFAALSAPSQRVRRALPAAAAALLLAAQTVLTLSIYSVPQFAAAAALAGSVGVLLIQALAGRADAGAAKRTSRGLTLQVLLLLGSVLMFGTPVAVWLAAASGLGLLFSLSGLRRSLKAARASQILRPATDNAAPAGGTSGGRTPEEIRRATTSRRKPAGANRD
jgi:hypothetical protein